MGHDRLRSVPKRSIKLVMEEANPQSGLRSIESRRSANPNKKTCKPFLKIC